MNRAAIVDTTTGVVQSLIVSSPFFGAAELEAGQTIIYNVPDTVSGYGSHVYNFTTQTWVPATAPPPPSPPAPTDDELLEPALFRRVSSFPGTAIQQLQTGLAWAAPLPAGSLLMDNAAIVGTNLTIPQQSFTLEGAGIGRTSFQPSNTTVAGNPFIHLNPTHNGTKISDFSVFNTNVSTGTTTTFLIKSTAGAAAGQITIENAYMTGGEGQRTLHHIHIDGSLKPTEPSGVRQTYLDNVTVFGTQSYGIKIESAKGVYGKNISVFPAGGPMAGAGNTYSPAQENGGIQITGTSGNKSDGILLSGDDVGRIAIDNTNDARIEFLQIAGNVDIAANSQNCLIIGGQYGGTKNILSDTSGWLQPRDAANSWGANSGWFAGIGGTLTQVIRTTLTSAGATAIQFPRPFKFGTIPTVTVCSVGTLTLVNQSNPPNATYCYIQTGVANTPVHIIAVGEHY